MSDPLAEQILEKIPQVASQYHRLILVVAPPGGAKTTALTEASRRFSAPLLNLNLELSRRLLDLTPKQRLLQVRDLVDAVVSETGSVVVLLDNTELLFDGSLQQDPLRLLQSVSRNRTVVAAWNGIVSNGYLTYAAPDHPEYHRYTIRDLTIICSGTETQTEDS
jgi:hypothetical protein